MNQFISQIADALKSDPRRDLYESDKRHWQQWDTPEYWITYQGGGPISKEVVTQMLKLGLLKEKYPNLPCYVLADTVQK